MRLSGPTPPEHSARLRVPLKTRFQLRDFSEMERSLLRKYGTWLAALAYGEITPVTDAQARFVAASQGSQTPETEFEKVWVKYSNALKIWKESEVRKLTSDPAYAGWSYPALQELVDSGHYHHSHDQRGA